MARQLEDKLTLELLPTPPRRGRPPTGMAMSPAQRKRAQRSRDRVARFSAYDDAASMRSLTDEALLDEVRRCMNAGQLALLQSLFSEIDSRAMARGKA